MSQSFIVAVSMIAPLYNIVLSFIVFYLLYVLVSMKRTNRKVFIKPWYFMFAAVSIFVLEEIITALKFANILTDAIIPRWFNAVFELCMVILFIYMLFVQINHVTDKYKKKAL